MKDQTAVLKKVLRYVRPYSPALIGSLVLALIFAVSFCFRKVRG